MNLQKELENPQLVNNESTKELENPQLVNNESTERISKPPAGK